MKLDDLTEDEKFSLLTPENKETVERELERLLTEQRKEVKKHDGGTL